MDAPDLEQKGLIGDSFYPCGKEAAEFLKKLIGDQTSDVKAFGSNGKKPFVSRVNWIGQPEKFPVSVRQRFGAHRAIMLNTMMSTMTKNTPPPTFQTIADE